MNTLFQKNIIALKKYLLLFSLTAGSSLFAQDKIDSALSVLAEKYQQEKIYLAYNKEQYVSGETIWLKGFVFAGYHLSGISTNLYTEVYDDDKVLVCKKTFPVFDGIAEGSITLPDSLAEGMYYVRAYTSWMLNFNEDFQYIYPIRVYNPSSPLRLQKASVKWTAAAYIEGGNLLHNKLSTVVIRLSPSNGQLPSKWQGYIYETVNPSQKIATFQSFDENIASFRFIPEEGKEYKVVIEDEHLQSTTLLLPQVSSAGINLSVQQKDATLAYRIDFANMPFNETYKIVGTIDNDIVYRATLKNTDTAFIHSFATEQLSRGVLRLTLFDKDYNVVTERLSFLHPSKEALPVLDSLLINTSPKALNQFYLPADSAKKYFVTVFNDNAGIPFTENNIASTFWLTGDFYSPVKNAAHYFKDDAKNKEALDALLITEKWQRFNWADVLAGKFPKTDFPKDNFLSYKAIATYKNKPVPGEAITLIIYFADSSRQVLQAKTDKEGSFLLDELLFESNARISYKFTNKKFTADNSKIIFTPISHHTAYTKIFPTPGYILSADPQTGALSAEMKQEIEKIKTDKNNIEKYKTLEAVTVKAKQKALTQLLDEKLSSGRFYTSREMIYDFVNVKQTGIAGQTLSSWLASRLPGDQSKGVYYLDEFISDKETIDNIAIDDVAMVKIEAKFSGRMILVYLRRGDEVMAASKPLESSTLKGYESSKLFVLPEYTNGQSDVKNNDVRSLFFWNIFFPHDSEQKKRIQFYNNDIAKRFRVIITSLSADEAPYYFETLLPY